MKRKELIKIIGKRMDTIHEHALSIAITGDKEAIHALRVQFKKLRAAIRLSRLEHQKRPPHIPEPLKELYRQAGVLRDRQLHYERIAGCYEHDPEKPAAYLDQLSHEIKTSHDHLHQTIDAFPFDGVRSGLMSHLPRRLHKKTFRVFFRRQKDRYEELAPRAHSDEEIHSVRKCIKDILYNDEWQHLPGRGPGHQEKKEWKQIEVAVGEYNNLRMDLTLLHDHLPPSEPRASKLRLLEKVWLHKKQLLKKRARSRLK